MRRLVILAILGMTAASCSGDGGPDEPVGVATTTSGAESTPTTEAPEPTTSSTSTTTTASPPSTSTAPSGPLAPDDDGIAVIAGPDVVVNRVSGSGPESVPTCLSPGATLTGVALVLSCDHAEPPTPVAIPLNGDDPVIDDANGHDVVAAGLDWILTCPTDGECSVLNSVTLAPLTLSFPIPGGEPPWVNSGLDDLLVVGRGDDRALYAVDTDVVKRVRNGPVDETWGGLVELADRTAAMEIEIDTGGSDGRPERIEYVDPITGEPLAYDDGADHNTLFDIGVGSIRVTPDLTIQQARVRAFDSEGAELWSRADDEAQATGAGGRVWIWSVGSSVAIEVLPLTGVEVDRVDLTGEVVRSPGAVSAHVAVSGETWLLARVDGDIGDRVVLVAV